MILAFNPLPGILQMLAGAAVLFVVGGLGLLGCVRGLQGAYEDERGWRQQLRNAWGVVWCSGLIGFGGLLVLALPTAEYTIVADRVEQRTSSRIGRESTTYIVFDTQGRDFEIPSGAALYVSRGLEYHCRIHRAIILGIRLGECRPA